MILSLNKHSLIVIFFLVLSVINHKIFAQAGTVRITVSELQAVNNSFCTTTIFGIPLELGGSDFVWEVKLDDGQGNSNSNPSVPILLGQLGGQSNHFYRNDNNGPYTGTPAAPNGISFNPGNGLIFDFDYACGAPGSISVDWIGYENDDPTNYSTALNEGNTGTQNFNLTVPAIGASNTVTRTAFGGNNCNNTQEYRITFFIEHIAFNITTMPDNICDAVQIPINSNQIYAWCPGATLEPNEPHHNDVSSNRSRWIYFVAPPSGEVEVSTDFGGTEFGTYFELYHAADGAGCLSGLNNYELLNGIGLPLGPVKKNKFDYLSHIEYSDGIDFLGIDPEAQLSFDACDPVVLVTYHKLLAGEVYYVQITADDANDRGRVEVRISDLGGSPADIEDVPCSSPSTLFGTAAISSDAGSPSTINLNFGCAFDGGNDHGETGTAHTNNNPYNYHAYDYDHPAANNATMNESVWFNFVAPNSGRIVFETDYQSVLFGESSAFWSFDPQFAPGRPTDLFCSNLLNLEADDGDINLFNTQSALIERRCLEPGYTYYGMVDPSDGLTLLNTQSIDVWLYDPSVDDPSTNPPDNDILCLSMANSLFEVPVKPANQTIPFSAVAGSNVNACIETLAGEPFSTNDPATRADQTVWHYFVVPPSGVVEMKIRAYIGLDSLNYAIYELYQDSLCYGGLQPATFTSDGTQGTPQINALTSGTTDFAGDIVGICCLEPGTLLAIQLDGGHPGDIGQYIIEYINEVEVYAGDSECSNGTDTFNFVQPDTAYICYSDTLFPGVMLDPLGNSTTRIANCMDIGFMVHDSINIPDSIINGNFTYLDTVYSGPLYWVNDGTQNFTDNTVHYVSPLADEQATWGQLICPSASAENSTAFVFLRELIVNTAYDPNNCIIDWSATGGLPAYDGSLYTFYMVNQAGDTVSAGTTSIGQLNQYQLIQADTFTLVVMDSTGCGVTTIIDATPCNDPCINNPVFVTPDPLDSTIYTCYPGGDSALVTLLFNGGEPSIINGELYTAVVSGSLAPNANGSYTVAGNGTATPIPFSFTVMDNDTWTVIVIDINGCPDTVSGTFDYGLMNCPDYCLLNPIVSNFTYDCNMNGTALVQISIGGGTPSINGSNYTVNVSGSTVFGQNFQNAQLTGNIGGTADFSFIVNSGDNWLFTVIDENSCTDTLNDIYTFDTSNCPICDMMPVEFFPDPIDSSVYICSSDGTADVTLFVTGGAPSIDNSLYTLTTSGSSIAGQNGSSNEDVGLFNFTVGDGDVWTVIATDTNSCADTASGTFIFNAYNLEVTAGNYDCKIDKSADLTLTLSGGLPANDGSNYLITIIGSTTPGESGYQIPVPGVIGGSASYTFNIQDGDNWVIILTDNSDCGIDSISGTFLWNGTNCSGLCNDSAYVDVQINGGSGLFNYICDSLGNGILSLNVTGGLPELSNGLDDYIAYVTINGNNSSYLIDSDGSSGIFELQLQDGDSWSVDITDALACDSANLSATFQSVNAVANAITPPNMLLGQIATLDGSQSTGNIISYIWTPQANVTDPFTAITTVQPMMTTNYLLEVSDSLGCADMDSVLVEVGRCIPNHAGFTPNGDGVNDFWEIPCLDLFTNRVKVYNRWGQLVLDTENYQSDWDGTNLGQAVPDATYYYVISVDNPLYSNPVIYKGTVTIIR